MWTGLEHKKTDVQGSLQENVEIYDTAKIKKYHLWKSPQIISLKKKDRDTLVIATKKGTDVVFQLQSTVLKCT